MTLYTTEHCLPLQQAQICAYANINMAECTEYTRRNIYGSVVLSESDTLMEESEQELDSSVDQSDEVCVVILRRSLV